MRAFVIRWLLAVGCYFVVSTRCQSWANGRFPTRTCQNTNASAVRLTCPLTEEGL
jgi:hypothetical protein